MSHKTLPHELLGELSEREAAEVTDWWAALDAADRQAFIRGLDSRTESITYMATVEDGKAHWHPLPLELRGTFFDEEDAHDHALWKQQHFDYVAAHPEIRFFLVERQFHICRAHADAQAVLKSGVIPSRFRCPLKDTACPMRTALRASGGRSIRLSLVPAGVV